MQNDFAQARHYASSMGRFMSPDPSGLSYANPTNPQSFNLYAYVLNNPLNLIDPTGYDECKDGNGNNLAPTSEDDCNKANGYWISGTDTTITVRPDGNSGCTGLCLPDALDSLYALEQINYNIALQLQAKQDPSPTSEQYVQAIAAAAPRFCGGGAFAYGGKTSEQPVTPVLATNQFAGGMVEVDTQSGISKGGLFEAGAEVGDGEVLSGGGGRIISANEKGIGSAKLLFGGYGIGIPGTNAHAAGGLVGFTSGTGLYVEAAAGGPEVGVGVYANITTNAGCIH